MTNNDFPEPEERTVRIPVQWIDGHWQLMGGGNLPTLSPNACADLLIPAVFLDDEEQRQQWTREVEVKFLPAGAELFARVSSDKVPSQLWEKTEDKKHNVGTASRFVQIVVKEDISLALTLGKKGTLVGGKCTIPVLKVEADSINEAYSKIVRAFQPRRKSDTGNVFSVVFFEDNGRVFKLDVLRERATNAAAMQSARPRDRSETWCELATTLSRVNEVWNSSRESRPDPGFPELSNAGRRTVPVPDQSTEDVEHACREYYDFRCRLMLRRDEGLIAIFTDFHDSSVKSPEVQQLRELRDKMDRAVLAAYGWEDLAMDAKCDFFRENVGRKDKTYRLRWSDEFRAEVLRRLVSLNEQHVAKERARKKRRT